MRQKHGGQVGLSQEQLLFLNNPMLFQADLAALWPPFLFDLNQLATPSKTVTKLPYFLNACNVFVTNINYHSHY